MVITLPPASDIQKSRTGNYSLIWSGLTVSNTESLTQVLRFSDYYDMDKWKYFMVEAHCYNGKN